MKQIKVWVREDGQPPCTLAADSKARGPGSVYSVKARNAREGIAAVLLSITPEPDRRTDREAWVAWDLASEFVSRDQGSEWEPAPPVELKACSKCGQRLADQEGGRQ